MLGLYKVVSKHSESRLNAFLQKRLERGKEDAARIGEREGVATMARPEGALIWVHGASVGEAQSALILIKRLLERAHGKDVHVMITTGTMSSAGFLQDRLPEGCFHQFYPLDHPSWVAKFLDHWQPDAAIWMESELWPNMLLAVQERNIPAVMVNARLSDTSFKRWKWLKGDIKKLLQSFDLILTQDGEAKERYEKLGASSVQNIGNIKYSAVPLKKDDEALSALRVAVGNRPLWVYASTHQGEEEIALQVHQVLKASLPDVLTVIVPRHVERGEKIEDLIADNGLTYTRRSYSDAVPGASDDIYLADTMGELGLFYRLAPIACIGRSLSDDGGGGHNPIEAAQLHCGVLHGPNIQYQRDFFAEMDAEGAAMQVDEAAHLAQVLERLLSDSDALQEFRDRAFGFTQSKGGVVEDVLGELTPILQKAKVLG
ncbi:3-deoxy-D-manno-octulosonic acid transferase [Alphaproteobacteria bacterium]|nr:3-deoxy-D-manno-octulosonic acid transferase [Alphaproteobacteria bacterium]